MNPPAAVQRPAAGPASPPRRRARTPVLLTGLAVVAVLLVSQLLAPAHFVSRVTVVNPSEYELLVEASNGHGGWLTIGTADHKGATTFGEVYDVGDVWQFRVSAQGGEVGRFQTTRAQLAQSHWHVRIPPRIGDALREAGVPPQP